MITPTGQTRSSPAPTDRAKQVVSERAWLQPSGGTAPSRYLWILCAICYTLAISLSIRGGSLWTDEAFSAWEASHSTFAGLLHSLRIGDSSDLQVGGYYLWLFAWVRLFGVSELALRTANIPFVAVFSLALVWGSFRLLRSKWLWLPIGLLPFIWQFASEVRAYMASLAFSTAALISLLAFLRTKSEFAARKAAWCFFVAALCGCLFHMLFLLCVPPLLCIAILETRQRRDIQWRIALQPACVFALPFLVWITFLIWTFTRADILYDYPKPGLRQMASVLYEIAGFAGFGPNRKFSLDFRAHVMPLAIGGGVLLAGFVCVLAAAWRARSSRLTRSLSAALLVGGTETLALAFITNKQPDARHLAALVPILLVLLMTVVVRSGRTGRLAALLLGISWMAADIRFATLPEYQKEDFRGAVAAAVAMQNATGAQIAVASDPAGAAYYGLDLHGKSPCYPWVTDCSTALDVVSANAGKWSRAVPAQYVARLDKAHAEAWLQDQGPIILITQMDRSRRDSPWLHTIEDNPGAPRAAVHGFEIILLNRR